MLVMVLTTPLAAFILNPSVNTSLSCPIVQILSCMDLYRSISWISISPQSSLVVTKHIINHGSMLVMIPTTPLIASTTITSILSTPFHNMYISSHAAVHPLEAILLANPKSWSSIQSCFFAVSLSIHSSVSLS